MRFLLVAACLLLLPAVATATQVSTTATTAADPSLDAAYCQDATASNRFVFQASCTRGSVVCMPWFSFWDPLRNRAESFCTI